VAHACDPSSLGGRDVEDHSLRSAQIVSETLSHAIKAEYGHVLPQF
jgi:hypothetical protein